MKITLEELKKMVSEVVLEASERKKKQKDELKDPLEYSAGYTSAEAHDFSKPLGADNRLHRQGVSNFGPYTEEKALRLAVRQMIEASLAEGSKASCQHLFTSKVGGIWESAAALFEAVCEKCGAKMDEKQVGFAKLKRSLAHKKGVGNAAALAASIGRKKYGAKVMAKKAASGRRK